MKTFHGLCVLLTCATLAPAQEKKADPAATKMLAEARAARDTWEKFPGFSADLSVNVNGKITKARVDVDKDGKVTLDMPEGDVKNSVRREVASLVSHRLPGAGSLDTPCAFGDDNVDHPLGRTVKVLNDELHSFYRIRDRQILEVNRVTGNVRFTINVLENQTTPAKKFLPSSYVVNTWDTKSGELKRSITFHNTWTRIGQFELPATVTTVDASSGPLEVRRIEFQNVKLK